MAVKSDPVNNLNYYQALKDLQENDPELTKLNMNNIKDIPIPILISLSEALKTNTYLQSLSMASTNLTDTVAKALGEAIEVNKTLTSLNLESNFITGIGIKAIMKALLTNETLSELRISNQRSVLGVQVELYIVEVLGKNKSIVKFGLAFNHAGPRTRAIGCLMKNNDIARKKRVSNGIEN